MINHACVANVEFRYNTLKNDVDVVAGAPIAAGDELVRLVHVLHCLSRLFSDLFVLLIVFRFFLYEI